MEVKASLNKPYTEEQRLNFIVEQNHNNGYEIRETEQALQAWGYTAEEIAEQEEQEFNRQFFLTSLGYVRRKVTMKDGSIKDFLSDILPLLAPGVPVLTYTRQLVQNKVLVTQQFIDECKQQVLIDFYGSVE